MMTEERLNQLLAESKNRLRKRILREWMDGEFKRALNDDAVLNSALDVLIIAKEKGQTPQRCVAVVAGHIVMQLIAPEILNS